ncbi:MAG TPA: OmpA family protein [Bryobacteraceae bacterium]|nr:OmpA family protein [Bryobacteraceae bacterium]
MRKIILPLSAMGFVLASAACSKKVAATTPPPAAPAPAPVASTPPAKPAPVKQTPAPAPRQVATRTPPPAKTITPQERATLNESLARLVDALFDFDKSTIRPDASTALQGDVKVIKDILSNYPNQKLVIEGHADERGSQEYNMALGDRRAHAVEEFLISMGIPSNQLTMISYGKERPVCTEETEDCWQRNRRAHVTAAQ